MSNKSNTEVTQVTAAHDNVFADLGFKPEEAACLKIKSQLMIEISEWIRAQGLKQEQAAKVLDISRPRVSDIVTGKIDKFTIDALIEILEHAGKHVSVKVA